MAGSWFQIAAIKAEVNSHFDERTGIVTAVADDVRRRVTSAPREVVGAEAEELSGLRHFVGGQRVA
jgi:hypothetical protein